MLADDVAAENFIPQHAVIKAVAQALQAAQELGTLHRIGAFAQIADGSGRAQHLGIRRQHQIALIFLGAANELFQRIRRKLVVHIHKAVIIAGRVAHGGIAGFGHAGVLLMKRDNARILFLPAHQHIPRCIAAAVINNDDLEVLPALAQDAVQASIQVPCPVPDGDNDADKGAVFHGVHLLWGKRFGKARRTGALSSFWGKVAFSVVSFFIAGVSPLRRRPEGFAIALWTASHPHLSLLMGFVTGRHAAGARKIAPCVRNDMQRKRMKSTSAVSSIRIIANRRESVKEA